MEEITGRLESWAWMPLSRGTYWIVGHIYGDTKGRFPDGTYIHTSPIISKHFPAEELKRGSVVATTYSKYLLGENFADQVVKART